MRGELTPPCDALRRAGYVRLPRWWVTEQQFDVIERMANGNKDAVYRIKKEVSKTYKFSLHEEQD